MRWSDTARWDHNLEQACNLFLFVAIALAILDLALFVILDIPVAYFIFGGDVCRKFSDIQMPLITQNERYVATRRLMRHGSHSKVSE